MTPRSASDGTVMPNPNKATDRVPKRSDRYPIKVPKVDGIATARRISPAPVDDHRNVRLTNRARTVSKEEIRSECMKQPHMAARMRGDPSKVAIAGIRLIGQDMPFTATLVGSSEESSALAIPYEPDLCCSPSSSANKGASSLLKQVSLAARFDFSHLCAVLFSTIPSGSSKSNAMRLKQIPQTG